MENSQPKKGLTFMKEKKVRKSRNNQLLIFVNDTTVIALNKAYVLAILNSDQPKKESA